LVWHCGRIGLEHRSEQLYGGGKVILVGTSGQGQVAIPEQ
jgi:hypothetical protein